MIDTVLCIPEAWQSTHELSALLLNKQNVFYSNGILADLENSKQFEVEL